MGVSVQEGDVGMERRLGIPVLKGVVFLNGYTCTGRRCRLCPNGIHVLEKGVGYV